MASNLLVNNQHDNDEQSKVALITGITGQVNKFEMQNVYACAEDSFSCHRLIGFSVRQSDFD